MQRRYASNYSGLTQAKVIGLRSTWSANFSIPEELVGLSSKQSLREQKAKDANINQLRDATRPPTTTFPKCLRIEYSPMVPRTFSATGRSVCGLLLVRSLLTKGSLFEINQVLFDVLQTGSSNDNRVSIFSLHERMVGDPAQSDFRHRELVLFGDLVEEFDGLEVCLVPISFAVVL